MQLGTIIFPQLKEAYFEEGEAGRAKFIEWSRLLTIPIAILQSIGFLLLLESQNVIVHLGVVAFVANCHSSPRAQCCLCGLANS